MLQWWIMPALQIVAWKQLLDELGCKYAGSTLWRAAPLFEPSIVCFAPTPARPLLTFGLETAKAAFALLHQRFISQQLLCDRGLALPLGQSACSQQLQNWQPIVIKCMGRRVGHECARGKSNTSSNNEHQLPLVRTLIAYNSRLCSTGQD